jgi:lipopolysaccharide transport system ATP-binding protein
MDKEYALEVENLTKVYDLGVVNSRSALTELSKWVRKGLLIDNTDAGSLVIGENNRSRASDVDRIYSLKDVSFKVKRGDLVGILGGNGAGKSTLLKILSKITVPSFGSIRYSGKLASLLEVGTGFHPELTGRENIYLNGAILGMSRLEINKKFNDIVDFSGCALYIDTPVKRYSSGMSVRLGFAVSAFLESDILIVDEVLAVGDIEFQRQAIGKMQDVSSKDGRTVLFVSHNMPSIKALCNTGIFLKNGVLMFQGNIDNVIDHYLDEYRPKVELNSCYKWEENLNLDIRLEEAHTCDGSLIQKSVFEINEEIFIILKIFMKTKLKGVYGYVTISDSSDNLIIESDSMEFGENELSGLHVGYNFVKFRISPFILNFGIKKVYLNFSHLFGNDYKLHMPGFILSFNVVDNITTRNYNRSSITSQILKWELINE